MSEYINPDITEFLVGKTAGFEKSPPDHLWAGIRAKVQPALEKKQSPLRRLWWAGVVVALISIPAIWIWQSSGTGKSQIAGLAADVHSCQDVVWPGRSVLNTNAASSDRESVVVENLDTKPEQITVNKVSAESNSARLYNILAGRYPGARSIRICNPEGKEVIVLNKPSVDKYGYYNVNINELPAGVYTVKIETENGIITHKTETF